MTDNNDNLPQAEQPPTPKPPTAAAQPDMVIPHVVAQKILDYLSTQPYRAVFQLIEDMKLIKPLPALKPLSGGGPRKRGSTKKRGPRNKA